MTYKIVATDDVFPDYEIERTILNNVDAELVIKSASTVDEVIEVAEDADGLLTIYAPITLEVFNALSDLVVIGKCGIGVDNIDLDAAEAHDVTVVNVPDYCIEEVSTHALSLLLAAIRKIPLYDQSVKNSEWDWQAGTPIKRIKGKTLGFIAFGTIPRRLAEKVEGFGLELIAFDPYESRETLAKYGVEKVDLEQLLSTSDFVSIHAPLTEETEGLLDDEAFSKLSNNAIIVNTSRGRVIDHDALDQALLENELGGAALDVLAGEPPRESPLLDQENVILTPHMAWYSEQAKADLKRSVAEDIANVLTGQPPKNPVASNAN